ncbi:MAG: AsmA-like C-terminal domain-containing protein [Syntrophobacterales bacterium]|nr:MAG: AsmA-like C-terminal domain-containing protein [Syntrophobacterales bacterium]
MKRTRIRVLFWMIAVLLIAIFVGSILLLRSIVLPERYRELIETRLREATGREVRIHRAGLRFLGGIGVEFEDLVIKDWDGKSDFIRARGLIFQMKLLPLLRRQLRWKLLIIERPSVRLRRSRKGNVNFWAKSQGTVRKGEKEHPHIVRLLSSLSGGEIRIREGSVHFADDFVTSKPTVVGLENLYIELTSLSMEAPIDFHVRARQGNLKGPKGRVWITGKLHPLPDPLVWSKIRITAEVRAKNINALPFRPYYGPHIPMRGIGGFLDIHAHYEGNFTELIRSWGQIRVKDVSFDYPQVFSTALKPEEFVVDYDVELTKESLIISDVSFRLPEIEIKGRCAISKIRFPERRIEALVTTGTFRFDAITKYIPFRILSPGFGKFLREITRRGRGRIVSLSIEGPIEDLSKLKDPKKTGLISGRMRLNGMTFPFARAFHPIANISGWAILEKGSLRFQDLRGSYGRSTLNAGKLIISRIYSSPKLSLTVNGDIDIKGIREFVKPGTFTGKGIPIRDISGRGDLQLTVAGKISGSPGVGYNGSVVLKEAQFSMKGISLPFATTSGKIVFSNKQFRFIGLRGKVGRSAFWAKGQMGNPWLEKPGRERLSFTLGGELDLRECFLHILPGIFPRISKAMASFSDISGVARLNLELNGRGSGFKGLRYKGRASLGKAIFRHHRMVSPIRFLKGEVHFTPQMIRFSNMEARSEGSYLKIQGSVRDYLAWKRSKIDLRIRAPNLDIGDFRLTKGDTGGWIWRIGSILPKFGGISLRVEEGRWRYTAFSNLTADISLADGRLDLKRFHCETEGGRADLAAWMDLAKKGEIAFALNPRLSHGNAGRFFRDLGLEEQVWITGAFDLWGSLMGRGRNGEEVRRSLEGKLMVKMEKGRIRRFHILSKVFSLLNVLQLFKGKLPGLTGEGLPYNTITGEIGVAKGIAGTENLLVDSDAMKITIIGEADIAREILDLTMGIHPLGTVDTIVSKVPVVGRIVTGKDEAIISYYVEVKGDFSNPKVRHIPLKSMGRGLIEIMRNVLETPMRIIPGGKEE